MIPLQQRQSLLQCIAQACTAGARLERACAVVGLTARTVQRWQSLYQREGDRRVAGLHKRVDPPNKLTQAQREAAMQMLNSQEFCDLPPSQIVPRLADAGQYVASESTLYRLLRTAGQLGHRRMERVPRKVNKPAALVAIQPDQVYCWDITYLPAPVRGAHFYLYLFVDLFSRKIVGWQVFDRESAQLAAQLLQDICQRQGIAQGQLTVHSDNGAPMKGETMLATMQRLGVAHSRSRPSVSNDNPYSESLFRTLKYRPKMPIKPFEDLAQARNWVDGLVYWYNHEHRHSAIGFITPCQRHERLDQSMLKNRQAVYEAARRAHPNRWSGSTRNWTPIDEVHLNPISTKNKDQSPTSL
jgi:putative transposase